jgi:hypothetical protein
LISPAAVKTALPAVTCSEPFGPASVMCRVAMLLVAPATASPANVVVPVPAVCVMEPIVLTDRLNVAS